MTKVKPVNQSPVSIHAFHPIAPAPKRANPYSVSPATPISGFARAELPPLSTHTFKVLKVPSIEDLISALRTGAAYFEAPLLVLYNVNRLFRNTFRMAGGFAASPQLMQACAALGVLNIMGVITDGRNMLEHACMVFAPNRTPLQRASSLIDALKSAAWIVGDVAIVIGGLMLWVQSTPAMQAFSRLGIYFVTAALLMQIVKHVVDLTFYIMMKRELEADVKSEKNYLEIKKEWEDRINNYHYILRAFIIIVSPEILKVLNELDTHLKANKLLDDESVARSGPVGEIKKSPVLDRASNEKVRYALLGRVKDKVFGKSLDLVASAVDTIACALIIAMPPAGAAVAAGIAGANFVFTTFLWGARFYNNSKSSNELEVKVRSIAKSALIPPKPVEKKLSQDELKVEKFVEGVVEHLEYNQSKKRKLHHEVAFLRGLGPIAADLRKKGYTVEPLSDKHRTGAELMVVSMSSEDFRGKTKYKFNYERRQELPRAPIDRGWESMTEWVIIPIAKQNRRTG